MGIGGAFSERVSRTGPAAEKRSPVKRERSSSHDSAASSLSSKASGKSPGGKACALGCCFGDFGERKGILYFLLELEREGSLGRTGLPQGVVVSGLGSGTRGVWAGPRRSREIPDAALLGGRCRAASPGRTAGSCWFGGPPAPLGRRGVRRGGLVEPEEKQQTAADGP